MITDNLFKDLLSAWEETYKKGQLTLWIFLSLKEGQKYVEEIKTFVETRSNFTMTCEEQSIYRNLRKYEHLGIVEFEAGKGNKGPDRKYYLLTKLGEELLNEFVRRNIGLFYKDDIKKLINGEN